MEIKFTNLTIVTYYEDGGLIYLPNFMRTYIDNLNDYDTKIADEIIYVTEDYVAYADAKLEFTPESKQGKERFKYNQEYMKGNTHYPNVFCAVEVSNIRRKEYFDNPDPIEGTEKIAAGIKMVQQYNDYVDYCEDDVKKGDMFRPNWV
jgi:hypothetical protein